MSEPTDEYRRGFVAGRWHGFITALVGFVIGQLFFQLLMKGPP